MLFSVYFCSANFAFSVSLVSNVCNSKFWYERPRRGKALDVVRTFSSSGLANCLCGFPRIPFPYFDLQSCITESNHSVFSEFYFYPNVIFRNCTFMEDPLLFAFYNIGIFTRSFVARNR